MSFNIGSISKTTGELMNSPVSFLLEINIRGEFLCAVYQLVLMLSKGTSGNNDDPQIIPL